MDSLIERGINLDFGVGGVFDRADEFQGENVFSRFMEVNCITEFDWNQEEVSLVDNFDLTIKAPDGITPTSITVVKPKED